MFAGKTQIDSGAAFLVNTSSSSLIPSHAIHHPQRSLSLSPHLPRNSLLCTAHSLKAENDEDVDRKRVNVLSIAVSERWLESRRRSLISAGWVLASRVQRIGRILDWESVAAGGGRRDRFRYLLELCAVLFLCAYDTRETCALCRVDCRLVSVPECHCVFYSANGSAIVSGVQAISQLSPAQWILPSPNAQPK